MNVSHFISKLKYVTENSFKELNSSKSNQLKSVNTSTKFNHQLTSIKNYQTYQINKNI
jgi:hypothetical protein